MNLGSLAFYPKTSNPLNLGRYLDFAATVEPVPIRAIQRPAFSVRDSVGDLSELISSIRTSGLLQPILVRPVREDRFEVVAGSRRLEACRSLHWFQIPTIIREMSEKDAFEVALTENIHRASLSVLEEARAFKRYTDHEGWGSIGMLASRIGKSESFVSHRIILLTLPESVQALIDSGQMKPSTAKQLVWAGDPLMQEGIAEQAIRMKLSTSSTMKLIKLSKIESRAKAKGEDSDPDFLHYAPLLHEKNKSAKALEQMILTMKLALARLDLLKEKCSDEVETTQFMQKMRYQIHQMIDECIREKKEAERRNRKVDYATRALAR